MSSASDLLLHLRPCTLQVPFDGRWYTIRAMDAVDWVVVLDGEHADAYEIFPGLAGADAVAHVEDALWEGRVTPDQLRDLALEVVGMAADRPWWVALRIIHAAKDAWDIVGINQAQGMSLAGWLDEIWRKIMAHIDPKKKPAWVSDIESPPKGSKTEVNYDAEEAAFLNAMKAVMR